MLGSACWVCGCLPSQLHGREDSPPSFLLPPPLGCCVRKLYQAAAKAAPKPTPRPHLVSLLKVEHGRAAHLVAVAPCRGDQCTCEEILQRDQLLRCTASHHNTSLAEKGAPKLRSRTWEVALLGHLPKVGNPAQAVALAAGQRNKQVSVVLCCLT